VIVCTQHRASLLEQCLTSVAALEHPRFEVIVVDNTSGDPATRRVCLTFGARYLTAPRRGLNRARNAGALAADGELVCYADDDSVVAPGWLCCHSTAFDTRDVAVTTGRILPIGLGERGVRSHLLDLGDTPFQVGPETPGWFYRTNFGGVGFGGNMGFRRQLFVDGFRFKESIGPGTQLSCGRNLYVSGDEFYAFFSLVKAGHRIAYVPTAVVHHGEPDPSEQKAVEVLSAHRHGAYLAMLWMEEPAFRGETLRYAFDAMRRRPRPWRRAMPSLRRAGRAQILLAAAYGSLLYVWNRLCRARCLDD